MDNASYIALSRQRSLFIAMENIANNVANANTTGFKSDTLIFQEYMMQNRISDEELAFSHDVSSYTNYDQGGLVSTGRVYDVAIKGRGFFQVETPLGERYTRVGNFVRNSENFLATQEGYYVLGVNGERIAFQEEDQNFTVNSDGVIDVNGEPRGQLAVMDFENLQQLNKLGTGLYEYDNPGTLPYNSEQFTLVQGMLEQSNVNSIKEITRMIEVSRAVGSTSGFIQDVHDLQKKAVEAISSTQ